jgi:hypothetical protein
MRYPLVSDRRKGMRVHAAVKVLNADDAEFPSLLSLPAAGSTHIVVIPCGFPMSNGLPSGKGNSNCVELPPLLGGGVAWGGLGVGEEGGGLRTVNGGRGGGLVVAVVIGGGGLRREGGGLEERFGGGGRFLFGGGGRFLFGGGGRFLFGGGGRFLFGGGGRFRTTVRLLLAAVRSVSIVMSFVC